MLFSERSIWTMVHGIGLGGGALIEAWPPRCSTSMLRARPTARLPRPDRGPWLA